MAPIKKLGRPKKIKEKDYKVPFRMIQEIKFEIYSPVSMGKKVKYKDYHFSPARIKTGIVLGAIISTKTKMPKCFLISSDGNSNERNHLYPPNEFVASKYLGPKPSPYLRQRVKRNFKQVLTKDIIFETKN